MEWQILYIIIGVVVIALVIAFYFIRKKMKTKVDEQQNLVNQHKIATSILVLEKRKDKV